MSKTLRVLDDVVCLRCGCLCDDISLNVCDDTIETIDRACQHGKEWFENQSPKRERGTSESLADVSGSDAAIERAAEVMAAARYPIFLGLESLVVEAQREAIGLADYVGGIVDVPTDNRAAMFPGVGTASCTWAEVRDRADLLVYWRCQLDQDHWRHEELIQNPARQRGATVLVLEPSNECELAWSLRGALRGLSVEDDIKKLATTLAAAKYGVLIHERGQEDAALRSLVIDLNRSTRFRIMDLGRPFNDAGLKQVVTWQTGYGSAVGLHRGYPVAAGGEFTAETVLRRGEADAALIVGAKRELSEAAETHLAKIPQITLFADAADRSANGTVFRSDGVTLPVRPPFSPSFPDAVAVLKSLRDATRQKMKR